MRTTHLDRKKTVKGTHPQSSRSFKFHVEEKKQDMSVEQYFKWSMFIPIFYKAQFSDGLLFPEYSITLRFPELPLVDVGGQKQNLMPAELCEILPNQAFKGKLSDDHTANMILFAAKPPNINALAISTKGLDELGFRPNHSPQLGAFGVSVGNNMAVVPARILPPPKVQYGHGSPIIDEKASWNLKNVRFARGARLDSWGLLVIRDGNDRVEFSRPDDPELVAVYQGFTQMCRTSGLTVEQATPMIVPARLPKKNDQDPTRSKAIGELDKAIRSFPKKPSVVMVLLSNGDKHIYSGLKYLCDVVLDVGEYRSLSLPRQDLSSSPQATVCVHSQKIRKEKGKEAPLQSSSFEI